MNKSIRKEDCVIEYDGIKYTPLEDFDLFTRKRINFINIDITKLKLPKDLEGKDVILDTKNYNNFLISISVVNNPKVISVNENSPFKEKKFESTEKELINILKSPLDKIKKYVYFNNNESYRNPPGYPDPLAIRILNFLNFCLLFRILAIRIFDFV